MRKIRAFRYFGPICGRTGRGCGEGAGRAGQDRRRRGAEASGAASARLGSEGPAAGVGQGAESDDRLRSGGAGRARGAERIGANGICAGRRRAESHRGVQFEEPAPSGSGDRRARARGCDDHGAGPACRRRAGGCRHRRSAQDAEMTRSRNRRTGNLSSRCNRLLFAHPLHVDVLISAAREEVET